MSENTKIPYKIYLSENEIPTKWYNVRSDMKNKPAPLLNPGTGQPMGFDDLRPVFCDELIKQELDNDTPYFDIPEEIVDFYKMYRPSPLVRAYCLEKALGTPAKIYYKFKVTIRAEATSSIPRSRRHITQSSRDFAASRRRRAQASGARLFQWHVHISDSTLKCSW